MRKILIVVLFLLATGLDTVERVIDGDTIGKTVHFDLAENGVQKYPAGGKTEETFEWMRKNLPKPPIAKGTIVVVKVERVIDGDTIVVTTPEGKSEKVQLIGVQAPEDEKMGQEATEFVKSLDLEGKDICLSFDVQERDKYGRLLAYVVFGEARWNRENQTIKWVGEFKCFQAKLAQTIFLNKLILEEGYATPMTIPPNVKYADLFKELYEEAREQKRGLWKEPLAITAEWIDGTHYIYRSEVGESCSNKHDCYKIDCSKYDSEVKSGYKPDCVDNECKCMCYGCK